jgi:hypothetical protein
MTDSRFRDIALCAIFIEMFRQRSGLITHDSSIRIMMENDIQNPNAVFEFLIEQGSIIKTHSGLFELTARGYVSS